jgi:hypothetical protein
MTSRVSFPYNHFQESGNVESLVTALVFSNKGSGEHHNRTHLPTEARGIGRISPKSQDGASCLLRSVLPTSGSP